MSGISLRYSAEARKYFQMYIPPERVDVEIGDSLFEEDGKAYCQIHLAEMCLARGIDHFSYRYPVAHTSVSFNYDGATRTIPTLASPTFLTDVTSKNLDHIIQGNYDLTGRFPYNSGNIVIEAGLYSLITNDPLGRLLKTIWKFSGMLKVPELASVIGAADNVRELVEEFIGPKEDELVLGYRWAFNTLPGSQLREGYFVAILAEPDQINQEHLCVVNNTLCMGYPGNDKAFTHPQGHTQLTGYNYLLFRIEKHYTQNYDGLKSIKSLVSKAQKELEDAIIFSKPEKMELVKTQLLPAIKFAIFSSPDIAKFDRIPLYLKIEKELQELGLQGIAAQQVKLRSLTAIMQRPLPEIDPGTAAELAYLDNLFK